MPVPDLSLIRCPAWGKVKHCGRTETIKTRIGVKNSKGKTAKDKKKK